MVNYDLPYDLQVVEVIGQIPCFFLFLFVNPKFETIFAAL